MKGTKHSKWLILLVSALMSVFMLSGVVSAEETSTSSGTLDAVYLNGSTGNDGNEGNSAAQAVKTLDKAQELVSDSGAIYICGQVTINNEVTLTNLTIKREEAYTGTLFYVSGSSGSLTLVNTIIDGNNVELNSGVLVNVSGGGTLNIKDGAQLINNEDTAVYIFQNSYLNMNGGTIKNNYSKNDSGQNYGGDGGAVYIYGGTVTLTGGIIESNTAESAGGGICNLGGTVNLNGAEIKGNSAARGGGVYVEGYSNLPATLVMEKGTISENKLLVLEDPYDPSYSYQADGGGICAWSVESSNTVIDIRGGVIEKNIVSDETAGTEGVGSAISLNSSGYGYFPTLNLSGSPKIAGDVFLWDESDQGPVIQVTDTFTPVEPVNVDANYKTAGTVAVTYNEKITPNISQFVSADERMGFVADGQSLKWEQLLRVVFKDETNKITYKAIYLIPNSNIEASLAPTTSDDVPARAGYTLDGWKGYGENEKWDFATDTVNSNMTLLAVWSLNAPAVSLEADQTYLHGDVTLKAAASHDATVTYAYQWYKDGQAIDGQTSDSLTATEAGSYTVKVAASDGTLTSAEAESNTIVIFDCSSAAFDDLNLEAWYHEATDYVLINELMEGYPDKTFKPNAHLSRAILVQILYNKDGAPEVTGTDEYTDTENDAWYSDAVLWATQNDIIEGYDESHFGPDDNVTREQMVAILYRYADYKGVDISASADLTQFTDADQVSEYAVVPAQWAVAEKLIEGMDDGTFSPKGNATRAQIATIIMRYCENVE